MIPEQIISIHALVNRGIHYFWMYLRKDIDNNVGKQPTKDCMVSRSDLVTSRHS